MSKAGPHGTVGSPQYLRPGEAAAILGVSTDTLRIWCEEKRHAGLRTATRRMPSGHRRYRQDVILAYARSLGVAR